MIAIIGPTSSGKTSLALKLAKEFDFDIVSFDSRQVYKNLDIGTGKIPVPNNFVIKKSNDYWIIDGIKVYMYDLVDITGQFSVAIYLKYLSKILDKIKKSEKTPLFVGGTGFFLNAILNPIDTINIKPKIKLREELSLKTTEELLKMLPVETINRLNNSEKNNKQRLIRKIELLNSNEQGKKEKPQENNLIIRLVAPREYLYKRVDDWVEQIWSDLMIEIHTLDNKLNGNLDYPVLKGIVYNQAISVYKSEIILDNAKQKVKYDLHAYIRRQETYFKNKFKEATLIDITKKDYVLDVKDLIKYHLVRHGN